MVQTILSITAISVSTIYSLYLLKIKDRDVYSYAAFAALLAVSALELFDLLSINYAERVVYWKQLSLFAEGSLPFTWLLFSLTCSRQYKIRSIPISQLLIIVISCLFPLSVMAIPVDSYFYSPDFGAEHMLYLGNAGFIFFFAVLIYLVIALINLEATFANAPVTSRWKIKYEIVGAGFLLSFLIFYYSQGLLYRTINMNLVPARSVAVILAVSMMAYSRLIRGNGVKVAVSRQLAYKSVVLIAVSLYLVGLGLMGEGMRYFGGSFLRTLAVVAAFLSGVGLICVLMSEKVKRKIKVSIHKNFYEHKYDYRIQWLQFTDRLSLSRNGDELLHSILSGYAETFGMGRCALFLYDGEVKSFRSAATLEMDARGAEFGRDAPIIKQMMENALVVDMRDGGEAEHGEFFRLNDISFVVPLFLNNAMDGFIVLGKPVNRNEVYIYEDFDLMKTLARQASSALLNLRLSAQLVRAREMEALGKVSSFVIHDLKNLVYTLSLVLDNAAHHMEEKEFQQDMLESLGNTVAKMKTLISRLKNIPEKQALKREPADLLQLINETAGLLGGGKICIRGNSVIAMVDREEIQKVVTNLLLNAVEATEGKGKIVVEVGDGSPAFIKVLDDGCGMAPDFLHEHLFTPFKTTKKKGLGIGLYQCKQIVEAHNGRIEADSELGMGTAFTVWLPKE